MHCVFAVVKGSEAAVSGLSGAEVSWVAARDGTKTRAWQSSPFCPHPLHLFGPLAFKPHFQLWTKCAERSTTWTSNGTDTYDLLREQLNNQNPHFPKTDSQTLVLFQYKGCQKQFMYINNVVFRQGHCVLLHC